MGGVLNKQISVGQDWVRIDAEKRVWLRKMRFFGYTVVRKKKHWKKTDTGESGRQAAKGQTCK